MALRALRQACRRSQGQLQGAVAWHGAQAQSSTAQQWLGTGQHDGEAALAHLRWLSGSSTCCSVPAGAQRLLHSSSRSLAEVEVLVPSMGDSISEGSIAAILKQAGDLVKEDDVIAQIETDKVTMDVKYTSATPGKVTSVLVNEGDTVVVGQKVFVVDESADHAAPDSPAETDSKPAAAPAAPAPKPAAPPPRAAPAPAAPADAASGPQPLRAERRVKMTRLRLRVAERLKAAQNTYAMLTTFNEVDMTNLMDLRNAYKDVFLDKHDVKLGFMSAFVKAAANALQEVPAVNGVIDGDEIIYRDYCDISIAVATPKGLVVPVLRDADKLNFAGIEKNINALGRKARDGLLSIDEMAGGTFTISNGGVYGSMLSTPIINPPQSAIMGMHNIAKRAMVVDGRIEARPIMYIALTYDHRLIDGREAVTFLKRVKEVVEDPRRLLLEV